ncbi:LysR family transcriptional regulator [Reyranella sp. CPCC 100927]|uniref:LysR family transcriptional regulator n=1 Tax=Reyranella sp. CPCC 100927 TaxID=2599616 RepID=UPI0011B54ED6|nr:LysR family transcriptional regulator [Reyranella sp. CPCC 100927]TWT12784.1 LysR family transcriptional regulator [Reyranella sp. CPCC 100927]
MPSVNLNRLAVFAAVAEAGSFTAAARRLGLTKAMTSQHVSRLEAELGAALLSRTTRRVVPTEAGAAFHADCTRILQETEAAVARVGLGGETPAGTLRITASIDFGATVIAPSLTAFMEQNPDLMVDFVATDQIVDLVGERFDLAIRTGWLRDSRLRAVRLRSFRQILVGAPTYLARYGKPRRPHDLPAHRWIGLTQLRSPLTWRFTSRRGTAHAVRVTAHVLVNTSSAARTFAISGAGLSVLPDSMIEDDIATGRLVPLLPSWNLPEGGVHAVYPATRYPPAKVRLFIDFLRTRLARPSAPLHRDRGGRDGG